MYLGIKFGEFLFVLFSAHIVAILALSNNNDVAALNALKANWKNLPPNWVGSDPCGGNWEGIVCSNNLRVTSLRLASMGLAGSQFEDLSSLSELQFLDLSYNPGLKGTLPASIGDLKRLSVLQLSGCGFFGSIPGTIGSLQQLTFLSLRSNNLSGEIPFSIGKLSELSWLDLSENQLVGPIPVSPGLDGLNNAKHFHLSSNQLSGIIPPELFSSNMKLIHVIFDDNKFTGSIPPTMGVVKTLEIVRLDRNLLNGTVPSNLNGLTSLTDLRLSNNILSGPIPDLTGIPALRYLDMSNNSFDGSNVPSWFTTLQSLTTLFMENVRLKGEIPVSFFSLPHLETVVLSNNNLNGTLDIGGSYDLNLTVDLSNNLITEFLHSREYNIKLSLLNNPICQESISASREYCRALNVKS